MPLPKWTKELLYEATVEIPWTGCWVWMGSCKPKLGSTRNYVRPRTRFEGRIQPVARVAYKLYNGDPTDAFVLHTCDNCYCVSPHHLYLGDHNQNMKDMKDRKRSRNQWTGGNVKELP